MIPRHAMPRLLDGLRDTPVVYLQGARQSGKSTLVQEIARRHHPAQYLTLDTAAVRMAAERDPEGFVSGLTRPVVIDEAQRVPALALAIKAVVDVDRKPGQFLLTGSAGALALPKLAESLAGRVEIHTLWPFSQGELEGSKEALVDRLFSAELQLPETSSVTDAELIRRLCVGGFPEVRARHTPSRKHAWFESYVETILQRDVRDLTNIERLSEMPRLLTLLASRAAQLVNFADTTRMIGIPTTTLKRYLALMETTFLVRFLPAWFSNVGKRLAKAPKLLLVDTGLLSNLLDLGSDRLASDRVILGQVLENFVAMEIVKQLGWSQRACRLFHFRTHSGAEADLLLEDTAGRVVGLEVKSAATLSNRDFRGLQTLREATGNRFVRGAVLYTGTTAVPFGKDLHAIPISQLWS